VLQAVDAARASQLAGIRLKHGGLWFPAGGWAVPPEVCARLADHPLIKHKFGQEVTTLARTASGWHASGEGWQMETEQVAVCCAHDARKLQPFAAFPLQPVRGQITGLPATDASSKLKAILCAEGYCTPAAHGLHVAGATTVFDDDATELRTAEHRHNLAQIAAHMPALAQALGQVDFATLSGRAAVRCSVPGATPLAGEVEPGLYCSLAHGTRGLLTAGITGEGVAAAMCGHLAPLPCPVLDALAPRLRFAKQLS